jgi:flagellar hook assembly protein FlgD
MLAPGFPNPFSAATTIRFRIPDGGRGEADVDLTIFDALGRRVVTLARGRHASGDYEVSWDGSDAAGRRVGAGVYFSRLRAGHTSVTRKLIALP